MFSHNDILEGNIMFRFNDSTKPILIDFEYAQMNIRGADLACYYNETMISYKTGVDPNFRIYTEFEMPDDEFE